MTCVIQDQLTHSMFNKDQLTRNMFNSGSTDLKCVMQDQLTRNMCNDQINCLCAEFKHGSYAPSVLGYNVIDSAGWGVE